ncbi:hypothetical protein PFISCL1PPCAC_13819, partial [Pristionchus fissidentatus]
LSVTDAIETSGFGRFQLILCAIGGLSWLAGAMEVMLLSILSPSLECEWSLTPFQQSLSTTFVFAGWMVSSPVWGRVCDKHGRRTGLLAASLVGFVFGVMTAIAPSFPLFLAARFLVGAAIGGLPQSVTLTAEFLPASYRARCLTILKAFFAVGAAIEAGVAIVVLPNLGWRWLVGFSALPLALMGLCCWWLPESVRFDISKGRLVEVFNLLFFKIKKEICQARATLDRIARINGRSLPEGELQTVNAAAAKSDMTELLRLPHRRTTLQLWIIWTLFGLLYYGLAVYTTILLHSAELNRDVDEVASRVRRSHTATACRQLSPSNYVDIVTTSASEVPGFVLTMFAIDCIGRRATLVIGFALFSACSAALIVNLPRNMLLTRLFV